MTIKLFEQKFFFRPKISRKPLFLGIFCRKMAKSNFFLKYFFDWNRFRMTQKFFQTKISSSKIFSTLIFLWAHSCFFERWGFKVKLAPNTIAQPSNQLSDFLCEHHTLQVQMAVVLVVAAMAEVTICSLGNISVMVKGIHVYDGAKERQ